MKRWTLVTALLLVAGPGFSAGTTAANFLKIGVGARNVALGETGATEKGVDAAYWNPAGLAVLPSPAAGFMHARQFDDVTFEHFAFAYPGTCGTWGISADYLTMDNIEKYDNTGTKMNQSYRPSDMAVSLSYARMLGRIPWGVNLKYIRSAIDDAAADAYAVDTGLLFDRYLPKDFSGGFSAQNIGTSMKFIQEAYPLPLNMRMGLSWRATPRVTIVADANKASDTDIAGNGGVEYLLPVGKNISIAPRAGYKTSVKGIDGMAGITAGIGIVVNAITFDYALVSYGDLDNAQRVSLIYRFAPTVRVKKVIIKKNPPHMPADIYDDAATVRKYNAH